MLAANIVALLTAAVLLADQPAVVYKKMRVFVLIPPDQILPGVKKLGVLDFAGQGADGRSFADVLTSRLFEKQRGIQDIRTTSLFGARKHSQEGKTLQQGAFTDVFVLIERNRLAQVLQEQRLARSGLLDEAQAAQVGKILGVDAIVVGTLSFAVTDQPSQEERTYTQNRRQYTRYVSCVQREGLMKVQARVVSAESGQVLGSVDRPLPIKVKHCEDEEGGLPTQQSVAEASSHDLAEAIANYVAPHFELREFELEKIRNKQFEGLGERAAELAEALRVDEAYAIYKSIHDQDAYSPEVLVDLAILNEVVGNWRQAKEFYDQAFQLKKSDDYKRGLDRMTRSLSFRDALAQLGVVIQEHTFAAAAEDVARATAKLVEIRGGGGGKRGGGGVRGGAGGRPVCASPFAPPPPPAAIEPRLDAPAPDRHPAVCQAAHGLPDLARGDLHHAERLAHLDLADRALVEPDFADQRADQVLRPDVVLLPDIDEDLHASWWDWRHVSLIADGCWLTAHFEERRRDLRRLELLEQRRQQHQLRVDAPSLEQRRHPRAQRFGAGLGPGGRAGQR